MYTTSGGCNTSNGAGVYNQQARCVRIPKANFNKADIDNNVPVGTSVPLTFTANFINNGVQKKLTSTVNVQVVK